MQRVWFLLLALGLILSARDTAYRATELVEFAGEGDPFGYLQMAQTLRKARLANAVPDFTIHNSQADALIEHFTKLHWPVRDWQEVVAPHAHHYFEATQQIGPQYPPGTAMVLSRFPEGHAVPMLNSVLIATLLAMGLAAIAFAAFQKA